MKENPRVVFSQSTWPIIPICAPVPRYYCLFRQGGELVRGQGENEVRYFEFKEKGLYMPLGIARYFQEKFGLARAVSFVGTRIVYIWNNQEYTDQEVYLLADLEETSDVQFLQECKAWRPCCDLLAFLETGAVFVHWQPIHRNRIGAGVADSYVDPSYLRIYSRASSMDPLLRSSYH